MAGPGALGGVPSEGHRYRAVERRRPQHRPHDPAIITNREPGTPPALFSPCWSCRSPTVAPPTGHHRILAGEGATLHGVIAVPRDLAADVPDAVKRVEDNEQELIGYANSEGFSVEGLKEMLAQRY